MSRQELNVRTVVSAPFEENSFVAWLPGNDACLVIDPGLEPDAIVAVVEKEGLNPVALLCTHGHSDHIAGNAALKQRWPECPLVIGHGDAPKLTDPVLNLSAAFGLPITSPAADVLVHEGEVYTAAGIELDVWETPGHSPGHVVFVWRGGTPIHVFGGDVLFQGSIGRSDFPDGDFDQLVKSIHGKLFTLPDDTVVWPGHGNATTIGAEKRSNPFVGARAGYRE